MFFSCLFRMFLYNYKAIFAISLWALIVWVIEGEAMLDVNDIKHC